MPRLRQITCQIEWPQTGLKFEEYGTVYGDGLVETFVAVPDRPQPFCIHLTSKGYIAEGLAMLVYIDGEYQCNRNRLHLKRAKMGESTHQTEVDFRLRQKEKTIGGGRFIGRDWRFDCHNIVPSGQFPGDFDPRHFEQLGVIEVIVLRCRAKAGDDSGSESFTHESILGEIDTFGQPLEESTPPGKDAGDHKPTVADAATEAEGFADLAGFMAVLDGAADGPYQFRGEGTGDQVHHLGLDGDAPPGYWPYHPQPQSRTDYKPESRPERRVHFDYGSPTETHYSPRAQPEPETRSGQPEEGYHGAPAGNGASNWQSRASTGRGGYPAWPGPQPAPAYAEETSNAWKLPYKSWRDVPQAYGNTGPNEYSDFYHLRPYIPPLKAPIQPYPAWTGTECARPSHAGWIPAPIPSALYPVLTSPPQFPLDSGYPTASIAYPPWYHPPYGFHSHGHTTNHSMPAEVFSGNRGRPSGSLDPAKEENNRQDDAGSQAGNNTWSGPGTGGTDMDNSGNKNITAGGWDDNDNNNHNLLAGDNACKKCDQPPQDHQQEPTLTSNGDWENHAGCDQNSDQQAEDSHGGLANNDAQNNQIHGNWDSGGQYNLIQGNWDPNAQNHQAQGNWEHNTMDNGNVQPQPNLASQVAGGAPQHQLAGPTTRSLYGPYGAYYSTLPYATSTLSPAAEAEEEPPFDVPETIAAAKDTTHQVQPGKGYLYTHQRASPMYMDRIEEPYARFVFKYRTKEQIERELGIVIECEPTGDEEKRKFTDKTQDELIELLLRAQNALGGKIPSPPPPPRGEDGAKQGTSFNPAPIPAPTAYKYLKYELPKGRSSGLGISSGASGASHVSPALAPAQRQQLRQHAAQQSVGAADWPISSSGPAGDWGAPSSQQQIQQPQQSAANWQTAVASGNPNQSQNLGGGISSRRDNNANMTNQSSPADEGWGPVPSAGNGVMGGGLQEAPAGPGGW